MDNINYMLNITQYLETIVPGNYVVSDFCRVLNCVHVYYNDANIHQQIMYNSIMDKPSDFVQYNTIVQNMTSFSDKRIYVTDDISELITATACRVSVYTSDAITDIVNAYYQVLHNNTVYMPRIALNRLMSHANSGIILHETSITQIHNKLNKYINEVNKCLTNTNT